MKRILLLTLFVAAPVAADQVFTGQWGGLVPTSMQVLDDKTLRFCIEDLVHRCQGPVPYHRENGALVVEHRADGLRWTYTPRADGGYDAAYWRWDADAGYVLQSTAILRAP